MVTGNFSTTNLSSFILFIFFVLCLFCFFFSFGNINLVPRDYQIVKIIFFLNESVQDRTRCPAIQVFARSIPNSDQTLSVDRPLYEALTA